MQEALFAWKYVAIAAGSELQDTTFLDKAGDLKIGLSPRC